MGAGATAIENFEAMRSRVVKIGKELGLHARTDVVMGEMLWGSPRKVHVVFEKPTTEPNYEDTVPAMPAGSFGLWCVCQYGTGGAIERFFSKVEDIKFWPMDITAGIVYHGFDWNPSITRFRSVMYRYGAFPLEQLADRLRRHFGIPMEKP